MAIFYKNQSEVEALSRKTGVASYRLSEQRTILFGGRGGRYEELQYLRSKLAAEEVGDSQISQKLSDAWIRFGTAESSLTTKRYPQMRADFHKVDNFP